MYPRDTISSSLCDATWWSFNYDFFIFFISQEHWWHIFTRPWLFFRRIRRSSRVGMPVLCSMKLIPGHQDFDRAGRDSRNLHDIRLRALKAVESIDSPVLKIGGIFQKSELRSGELKASFLLVWLSVGILTGAFVYLIYVEFIIRAITRHHQVGRGGS